MYREEPWTLNEPKVPIERKKPTKKRKVKRKVNKHSFSFKILGYKITIEK